MFGQDLYGNKEQAYLFIYKIVHFAARSRGQATHEEIDGVTYAGYLCTENSVNGLVVQICMAISDKMVYSSKRGYAYQYLSQFQWDGTGEEFEQFIEALSR